MGHKYPATVRQPPLGLWNSTDVVAFPNDHKHLLTHQDCCGETAKISLYKKACFRFCSTYGNQTNVTQCMESRSVQQVTALHNDNVGKSVAPQQLSKPSLGLLPMVVVGYFLGPLGEGLLAV